MFVFLEANRERIEIPNNLTENEFSLMLTNSAEKAANDSDPALSSTNSTTIGATDDLPSTIQFPDVICASEGSEDIVSKQSPSENVNIFTIIGSDSTESDTNSFRAVSLDSCSALQNEPAARTDDVTNLGSSHSENATSSVVTCNERELMADNSEGWSRDLNQGGAEGTDPDDQFGLADLSERLAVNVDTEGGRVNVEKSPEQYR